MVHARSSWLVLAGIFCAAGDCRRIESDLPWSLIQTQVRIQPDSSNLVKHESVSAATDLLSASVPLAWLHVPKAGSSLANTLLHTPTLCPGVGIDEVMNRTTSCQDCNDFNDGMLGNFRKAHGLNDLDATCPGLLKWGWHQAIGDPGKFKKYYKGKGVAMIRQPEQRLISSYKHDMHDMPDGFRASSISQYADVVQGCQVRMLTHHSDASSYCGDMSELTSDDVKLAENRLEKFAFVGLTEEWDLSICLFRAMFGGSCYGSDFGNTRLPRGVKTEGHDTSILNGFVDRFDGQLYQKAQDIFAAEMQRYGVNETSCQPCWDHADAHWTANT